MGIHNQPIQGPRTNQRSQSEPLIDITRPNREGIQRVVEDLQTEQSRDRVDLSEEGRVLATQAQQDDAKTEENRKARVADLRKAYLEGSLNTPARLDKAAERMLAGE